MDFLDTMHAYFQGEKTESAFILLASAILFLSGLALVFLVRQPFTRSLGLTLVAAAIVGGAVGGTVFTRTERQVEQLAQLLAADPASYLQAEQPRMRQVVRSFAYYRVAYSLAAIAAALLAWSVARPALQGLAVGLLVFAAFGLVIDHYAEHRAIAYLSSIEGQAQHTAAASR